jgi:hypothetical protein
VRAERRRAKRRERNGNLIMVALIVITTLAGIWTLQAAAEVGRQLGGQR